VFVDEVDISVKAGDGGRGSVSFRREKFVPRGGPDGGDGGKGGSVYLVATPHRNTLVHFRFNPEFHAERGRSGSGALKTGKTGNDLEIPVPVGTLAQQRDPENPDELVTIADLVRPGQRVLVAKGGRGGLGNAHFVSSTNRSPRKAQPGEPGEERKIRLQLKLLADMGLVGFPNAGKSTLIARISAAKPKIADYPFTTLTPNLGVVTLSDDRSFVVADVPGLIEGAHEGHGLGHQFLRHIERTKVLVHLVDVSGASGRDPVDDFVTIRRELELYNPELLEKPQIVAANKLDAVDDRARVDALEAKARELNLPFHRISAVTGEGVQPLLESAWPAIADARAAELAAAALDVESADDTLPAYNPLDAADPRIRVAEDRPLETTASRRRLARGKPSTRTTEPNR
jgi:GTP-binding protein